MANEKYVMMSDNPTGTGSFSLNRKEGTTIGDYSHAEGHSTTASGTGSHAEGDFTTASGGSSHAEGYNTTASGYHSHAEGGGTIASDDYSHAEGASTRASGIYSHAEGFGSSSSGRFSHSEGKCTAATGDWSHAEGGGISDPLVEMTITSVDGKVITCADTTFSSWSTIKKNISVAGVSNNRSIITDYNSSEKTITIQKELDFQVGDILTISTYGSSIASGNYSHAEGYRTIASGEGSHAEGQYSTASHEGAHAEGNSRASGRYSHAEGGNGSLASGSLSHAEGSGSTASGSNSHAEGLNTIAYGSDSHAEGLNTYAYGDRSHAEGGNYITDLGTATISAISSNVLTISDFTNWSNISNNYSKVVKDHYSMIITSYSSSNNTITLLKSVSRFKVGDTVKICKYGVNFALGNSSHSEGQDTQARGTASHSEGRYTTASGDYSHAEGGSTTASGSNSHAEGTRTTASGNYSHAEGYSTTASGTGSHAEGDSTKASGGYSHAEGYNTKASRSYSHAEGNSTKASGECSHAEGDHTTASNHASHASGKYSVAMTTGGAYNNTIGTAFVIGNGTDLSALSNAFSVQYDGTVKAKSTITASTTADYAEFFEWIDKNTDKEDRVGHFVTLDGDKIKIATSEDDYILGIVSGEPFVLGNGDCDTWNGMFLHDEFRRTMYEPAPKMIEVEDKEIIEEEYIDEETKEVKTREVEIVVGHHYEEVEGEYEGTRPILNPDYDPTQKYISRFDRAEWSPVGMLGVLAVLHDGTAEVNGYVTVNNEGIATKCTRDTRNSYRVIKKVSDKVVEVIFR